MGACFAVYRNKGNGFVEPVYQECLEIEFEYQGVPVDPQRELRLEYRGRTLKQKYVPDFVCYDRIILELKAARSRSASCEARERLPSMLSLFLSPCSLSPCPFVLPLLLTCLSRLAIRVFSGSVSSVFPLAAR